MRPDRTLQGGLIIVFIALACVVFLGATKSNESETLKWEYKFATLMQSRLAAEHAYRNTKDMFNVAESVGQTMEMEFNNLGEEGWELVCFENGCAIFKRPAGLRAK